MPSFFRTNSSRFFGGLGSPQADDPSKRQNYDNIKQQCLAQGALFEDRLFSPRSTGQGDIVWLRPYEISRAPKFISGGFSRFDVVQGELGDCWLIAAVANLTMNTHLFSTVVPDDQSFERNSYCGLFRFRFWQFGKWVEVIVDDKLPCRDGKLVFMHSTDPDEFWSPLLEKAYAKLHGSYDALRGGTTSEAMVDLTGGVTEFFDIQTDDAPANLFNIIYKAFQRGSLVGCSIEIQDDSEMENHLANGLIKGHAYSLNSIQIINYRGQQVRLLRMRNPWHGTKEWNGPWSDGSREWYSIDDNQKQQMGLISDSDGEFWMEFEDWRRNFTRVELCNLSPDDLNDSVERAWHSQIFEGSWIRGRTAGGCRNNVETFALNPQFIINLTDPDEDDDQTNCTVIVALMQKSRRAVKKFKMGSSDLTIGFAIYELKQGAYGVDSLVGKSRMYQNMQQGQQSHCLLNTDFFKYNASVARCPVYINLREVTARFSLPPGSYVIIPSTFDKNEEGDFILRVWTEAPVSSGFPPGITPSAHHIMPGPLPVPEGNDGRRSPSYPPMPSGGTIDPGDPSDRPAYPPLPMPPTGGDGPIPTTPTPHNLPYPVDDRGGAYPPLPDEPEIIRRRAPPPPPGPSIDINIGEIAGIIAGIISIISMCWNNYQTIFNTSQTYPHQGPSDAPFGQRMSTLQMRDNPHQQQQQQQRGLYAMPPPLPSENNNNNATLTLPTELPRPKSPLDRPSPPLVRSPADFVGEHKRTPSPR